jgi:hypothetical protein
MESKDIEFKISKLTLKENEVLAVKMITNDKIKDSDRCWIVMTMEQELNKFFNNKFFIYFDDELELSVINQVLDKNH